MVFHEEALRRYPACRLLGFPNKGSDEIFFAKHIIECCFEIVNLALIDTHHDEAVSLQQISRQFKTGVHHVEPVSVKSAGGFSVGGEFLTAFTNLSGEFKVVLNIVLEV